ncbi:hypothetical protein V8D89_009054 [Ganoderma adspersum]
MPMEQDNAWPADLLGLFEHWAGHATFEDRYVPAYNQLLQYCFGLEHPNACIAPGNPYSDDRRSTVTHPIVFFVVYDLGPEDPILLGLSLLGTSMRIYCGDVKSHTIDPPAKSGRTMPPSFLAGEWDLDILSQEGFEKIKTVIGDITAHSIMMIHERTVTVNIYVSSHMFGDTTGTVGPTVALD